MVSGRDACCAVSARLYVLQVVIRPELLFRVRQLFLHRKEVFQPQVPLRLPCYDFIPVTSLSLGPCLLAVGS